MQKLAAFFRNIRLFKLPGLQAGFVLWVSLLLPCLAYAFSESEDVYGASDYPGLERYPDSKIDRHQVKERTDYLVALGSIKKVDRALMPEYSKRVTGRLTRITYRIPDGHESDRAFQHYDQASAQGTPLFECHGRECGSSSHWANRIFGIARLYGPEGNQHYVVKRLSSGGQDLLIVIYAIERGNKRVYVQLDLLEVDRGVAQGLEVNPSVYLTQWEKRGRVVLSGLRFNDQDLLTEESYDSLDVVVEALKKNIRMRFWVVGHLRASQALQALTERSLKRAESVRDLLVKKGVAAERLVAMGVGPLAPVDPESKAGRVELVLQP